MNHLLTDTVIRQPIASVSAFGDPTYGTQVSIRARVERTNRVLLGVAGDELRPEYVMICEDEVLHTDRIYLPGDTSTDAKTSRGVLRVTRAADPTKSLTLYEVYV